MSTPWIIPRIWPNEPVFVIAGGPSLCGFDPAFISTYRSVSVNNSFSLHPNSDFLTFCDLAWWEKYRRQILAEFQGRIVSICRTPDKQVLHIRNMGRTGLSRDPSGVMHGTHSGYQAINLAYLLGANPIIGLGFDFRVWTWADAADPASYIFNNPQTDDRVYQARIRIEKSPEYKDVPFGSHWHRGHGGDPKQLDARLKDVMLPPMQELLSELDKEGVRFINCSPKSRLNEFAGFQLIDDVLENLKLRELMSTA